MNVESPIKLSPSKMENWRDLEKEKVANAIRQVV